MIRTILSILVLVFAASPAHAWEVKYPDAKIYAVSVWAEWCTACKVLDPKVGQAIEEGNLHGENVLFLRMDFTDKQRIYQSKMLARSLGLEEFLKSNGAGTGYMALVDAETKQELLRFNANASAEDIITGVQTTIEQASKP